MNIFILVLGGYMCTFLLSKHYGRKCGDIKCVFTVFQGKSCRLPLLPATWESPCGSQPTRTIFSLTL